VLPFGVVLLGLLANEKSQAGSVAAMTLSFERAVAQSARIVKGRVIATPTLRHEGRIFHSLEIRVEQVLKGPAPMNGSSSTGRLRPLSMSQHSTPISWSRCCESTAET
jgi:hypothetical protein